jgi:hypothetical protein
LLREFDDLINTETRGTSAVRKLLKSLEPLRSDRLRRDDQEDPIGEPIGIELTFRAALEKIGAQVVHFGARGRRKSPWMVREHGAALASSGFTTTKVSAGGCCFGHANAVSEIDVRPRTRSQGACWPLAIDVKASLLPSSIARWSGGHSQTSGIRADLRPDGDAGLERRSFLERPDRILGSARV